MNGWHVGISAVGLPLAELASRYGADPLLRALQAWQAQQKLDFLLVMTTHGGKEAFRRELGVVPCGDAATALLPRLVRPRDVALSTCVCTLNARVTQTDALLASDLQLQPLPLPAPGWPQPGGAYDQGHLKGSRKVVQPTLAQIFERLGARGTA